LPEGQTVPRERPAPGDAAPFRFYRFERSTIMDRRQLLTTLGATAAGFVAAGTSARAQHEGHHHRDKVHEDCLKACEACERSCNETFHHCYQQLAQGKKEHAKALHLVADCGKFCDLSADLIANQSPLMAHACAACAEACKACAAECDKFDSAELKACARACRECETSCRAMLKAMNGQ
jgi:hypothetical protein